MNEMTQELREFVEKVQNTMYDLYEEFNELDGINSRCLLSDLIDAGYELFLTDVEDAIKARRA